MRLVNLPCVVFVKVWQDIRSSNVSVSLINPGLVRTSFFDELSFMPDDNAVNALTINDIVDTLLMVIKAPFHCVLEEINLQPVSAKILSKKR